MDSKPPVNKGKRLTKPHPKYDYEAPRKEYIEGIPVPGTKDERNFPKLKEVAEKYGIPYPRLRKKASAERWTAHRDAQAAKVAELRMRKRARSLANNSIDFDEKAYNVAKIGMAMVATRLGEIAQESSVRKAIRDDAMARLERGEDVDRKELYSAVYHKELEGLAGAADRFQSIGQKALGTDAQKIEVSGPEGAPLQSIVQVKSEMTRDDPDRIAEIIGAMQEAGLVGDNFIESERNDQEADEIDAEVEEEHPAIEGRGGPDTEGEEYAVDVVDVEASDE